MIEWSNEQNKALTTENGNYLVSASAGSGKTAVLTERVFRLLEKGVKLSELLILTFTDLAASQMRDKIREKLVASNLPNKNELIACLDAANIQTYDSFSLSLVQKYHYLVNVHSDVQVLESTVEKLLMHDSVRKVLNSHYDAHDEKVLKIVTEYCAKDDETIRDNILKICEKANLKLNKKEFYNTYQDTYLSDSKYNQLFDEYYQQILDKIQKCCEMVDRVENTDYISAFYEITDQYRFAKSYDELMSKLLAIDNVTPNIRKIKISEDDKAINNFIKTEINELKEGLPTKEEVLKHARETDDYILTFVDLAKETDELMDGFKQKHNLYSFSDIAKFANKILDFNDIKNEIQNRYKYIMIDEYQDTSDLQEEFISKLANNNVYVVGDVKQSIYGFRNANCKIFSNKQKAYENHEGGEYLPLKSNYRSRREVLNDVNRLFNSAMTKEETDIDYKNSHQMVFGRKEFDDHRHQNQIYGLKQTIYSHPEKMTRYEYEARLIASDIQAKYNSKYKVFDKDERDVKYSDFAIITSTKNEYEIYKKVFGEYKIPLFINRERKLSENMLTIVLRNIFRLLAAVGDENAEKTKSFVHAFISIYRSFLFEHDDNEIINIAKNYNYSDYAPYKILQNIKNEIKEKTLPQIVESVIKEFNIYERLVLIGDITENINVLEYFHKISGQLDKLGYTLADFANYFDDLDRFEIEPAMKEYDDTSDSVKLLTIFASKGLQYQICYFPETDRRFNEQDLIGSFIIDLKYGLRLGHTTGNSKDFVHGLITKESKAEFIKERVRLFYVALTRAIELGIILGDEEKNKTPVDFSKIDSLHKIYSYSQVKLDDYTMSVDKVNNPGITVKTNENPYEIQDISPMEKVVVDSYRASKQSDDSIDEDMLLLGNKYHYYLELLDFKTKDTSFIKNNVDRERIDNFISSDIFKDISNAQVAHEYSFFDELNNVHGVIDLLVRYSDHIDIIDFKLSNVSDEAYEKQVSVYKNYIKQISNLPIHTYVVGILSGIVNKVS